MHKGTYISAVILTYNEQDHIARCVQSLQDVADQVIVLDSNSTDNLFLLHEKMLDNFGRKNFIVLPPE